MSGTVARSLGAMGDAMVGNANVNFDAGTLFIDGVNNNVGVGTTSPQALFHIERNLAGEIGHFVNNPNAGGYAAVRIGNSDRATNGDHLVYGSSVLGIRSKTGAPITFEPAGTERMRIDSTGRVTIPNQPMASGGPARGGDWFTGIVAPVSAHINIGSHMNTTTGAFTAPVAGRYYVYVGLLHNNTWYIYVNINGADTYLVSHGNAYATTGGAVIVSLQANDTIRFNTSGNYYGSSHGSYAIYLLS